MDEQTNLVSYSYTLGKGILQNRDPTKIKELGQFLTPPMIARYMAKQLGQIEDGATLLDPAVGSGVLVCAVIEQLIAENRPIELYIDTYEIDEELCQATTYISMKASQKAEAQGIKLHWNVYQKDFILSGIPETQPSLFNSRSDAQKTCDYVISNPPYFKLNSQDQRAKAASGILKGHSNIYTLFMALCAKKLKKNGVACFIVPRSFCSGVYFTGFRRELIHDVRPRSIHVFQSRDKVFKNDDVLQENIIFTFQKSAQAKSEHYWADTVNISTSYDDVSLQDTLITRQVPLRHFINRRSRHVFLRLPISDLDEQILDAVDKWDESFEQLGLHVSTGPVVPFRAKIYLRKDITPRNLPLLWMQNVKPYTVKWPLEAFNKPQAISDEDVSLLIPSSNYVLLRRFSAKEDRRRIIAAPYISTDFMYPHVGFENHLNFIYRRNTPLEPEEVYGLVAILNSALIDRYIRIVNGNTQINAAELRALPLPSLSVIKQIGKEVQNIHEPKSDVVDNIVFDVLWKAQLLGEDIPIVQETRMKMGKIEQAQEILKLLGLPPAQQNEISALTLLVLANLSEDSSWEDSNSRSLRVHDMLSEIKEKYGREYAENTRETIRRQVLHQFEQAGLIFRNPDDPALATNSPKTHYRLAEHVLSALRAYKKPEWEKAKAAFLSKRGALLEIYQREREQSKVPLREADGTVYKLSPGKHNKLQAAIVEDFGPRFAPGAKLLYLGDTARKALVLDIEAFSELGANVTDQGKLPDIVLYDISRNWLLLIEAVTSHGPISPKRQLELEELFGSCSAARIYVTAFESFSTFKRFLNDIAWETEVWIAEIPSHLIHFNGDKFLGPG